MGKSIGKAMENGDLLMIFHGNMGKLWKIVDHVFYIMGSYGI
jgi:hypothetical protein